MNLPEPQKVRRVRQKPRLAEVVRVERLTPHMLRVVLAGEELDGFTTRGPAEHLKVNFPPPGESKLVLPEWGPEGPILREGQQRPLNRTYTPRRWDIEAKELTVDFLLHGDGPGTTWAQHAQPGQVVAVAHQPGGTYTVATEADWYLIRRRRVGAARDRNAPRSAAGILLCSCLHRGSRSSGGTKVGVAGSISRDLAAPRRGSEKGGTKAGAGGAGVFVPRRQRSRVDRLRSRRHAGYPPCTY